VNHQEALEQAHAEAVDVEPIYVLGHVLGLGAYAPSGTAPTADNLQVALVVLAYDPHSDGVVRLPLLFEPDYAVRAGFVTQESLDEQIAEILPQLDAESRHPGGPGPSNYTATEATK